MAPTFLETRRVSRWAMRLLLVAALLGCLSVPSWTIANPPGKFTVDNAVVHAEFTYGGPRTDGMFIGGGGSSCGLTFLSFKATDSTRNLIFRNGAYGGKYDQGILVELEEPSDNGADHNTPDFTDGFNGVTTVPCTAAVRGNNVVISTTVQLKALELKRLTTLSPDGQILDSLTVTVTEAARYEYASLRTLFAASRYHFTAGTTSYQWGTNFLADAETFACVAQDGKLYKQVVLKTMNTGGPGTYVACMLDDRNGNDPDIVWTTMDSSAVNGVTGRTARLICPVGIPYMETALYNAGYAPDVEAHADLGQFISTWQPPNYGVSACTWPQGLSWTWVEKISLIGRPSFTTDSLWAYWKGR